MNAISSIAGISFTAPWVLAALALLPAIWFLLRVIPPLPRRAVFPPIKLLAGLVSEEETPAGTPLWLMILRLVLAAAIIIALAGPQIGRTLTLHGHGPVVLVIDNGWTAASGWSAHKGLAQEAVRLAQSENRPVAVITTAGTPDTSLLDAGAAQRTTDGLRPASWLADRRAAIAAITRARFRGTDVLWLSDGIDDGNGRAMAKVLKAAGHVRLYHDRADMLPLAVTDIAGDATGLSATLLRAGVHGTRHGTLMLYGPNGEELGAAPFAFASSENRTTARLTLPLQVRNRAERVQIAGVSSAGAVHLFDRGAPRRAIGIVTGGTGEEPLMAGSYYLERALKPYADTFSGRLNDMLTRRVSVLILADGGRLTGTEEAQVRSFVETGGLLIRFAGDRLAENADSLTPVPLRSGGRYLNGTLSWSAPQTLAPFAPSSPFAGLTIPPDVKVNRQILAEPSVELAQHSWAQLADGTPMVTAAPRGHGWIVLFHVTAAPTWSSLPLSGLYVSMLRRLLPLSTGVGPAAMSEQAVLQPVSVLDGFGRLHHAPEQIRPIKASDMSRIDADATHPPGLYGAPGAEQAINAMRPESALLPLEHTGLGEADYADETSIDLSHPLLLIAALLLLADALISLFLRGYIPDLRPRWHRLKQAIFPTVLCVLLLPTSLQQARAADSFAMKAALDTRLAYIVTGATDTDTMSRAGLTGLGRALAMRTSYVPPEPMAVNPESDDLSFFPLLYWPMDPREHDLSPRALARIADYMRSGGTLLIDTRDQTLPTGMGQRTLRRLLGRIDMPPLVPVTSGHVLTRAFYLLNDFPGRWEGGKVWVASNSGGDGVSPVIIGGADWAAAWAIDRNGRPMADIAPGGERQREMAFRFGINVAMYALTGNYKTDQIHAPTILKRLGQ